MSDEKPFYAKLTKMPKPTGASFTYVTPVVYDDATGRFHDLVRAETDKAIQAMNDRLMKHLTTPMPATVTTTCTRCSATIDPAAVEQHHERCFRVGDCVRISRPADVDGGGWWVEGELLSVDRNVTNGFDGRIRVSDASLERKKYVGTERSFSWGNTNTLRHIQRPGQAVRSCCPGATTGHVCGCDPIEARAAAYHKLVSEAPGPIGCVHDDDDDELQDAMETMEEFTPILPPEVDPLDVEYDGWKLRDLLEAEEHSRHEGKTDKVGWAMAGGWRCATPAQRAAVSGHWSQQLRARISATKERERLSVTYCEVDVEDEP